MHHDTYDFVSHSDCTGKAVLVTGANKGIGKAVAMGYAKAGASQIAITARSGGADVVEEIKQTAAKAGRPEPQVLLICVDVTESKSVKEGAAQLESSWGRLDILVNNAGFLDKFVKILDGDEDLWSPRRSCLFC